MTKHDQDSHGGGCGGRRPGAAGGIRYRRQCERGHDRADRDVSRDPDADAKDREGGQDGERRQDRADTTAGRDAFPAAKAEPHRVDVAHDRGDSGGSRSHAATIEPFGHDDPGCALRDIEERDQDAGGGPCRSPYVRRTEIAAADAPQIPGAPPPRQDQREGDRSDGVGGDNGDEGHAGTLRRECANRTWVGPDEDNRL